MVHQNQAGLPFGDFLHPLRPVLKAGASHTEHRQKSDQRSPKQARFAGQLMDWPWARRHTRIIHGFYCGFQRNHPSLIIYVYAASLYLSGLCLSINCSHFAPSSQMFPGYHMEYIFTSRSFMHLYSHIYSIFSRISIPHTRIFREDIGCFVRYSPVLFQFFLYDCEIKLLTLHNIRCIIHS